MSESVQYNTQDLQEIKLLKKAKRATINFVSRIFNRIKRKVKSFLTFVIGKEAPTISTKKVKF